MSKEILAYRKGSGRRTAMVAHCSPPLLLGDQEGEGDQLLGDGDQLLGDQLLEEPAVHSSHNQSAEVTIS